MRKFIICNTNPNREAHYERYGNVEYLSKYEDAYPYWLNGDYVVNSSGDAHNDITRAHLYNTQEAAERQRTKLQNRFCVDGDNFTGLSADRYPDSVGKEGYTKVAPSYEVVEVEVSVKIV